MEGTTACGHRTAHRKWKETKQQPRLLPGPAVPGSCLVSFHFLWAILCPQAVHPGKKDISEYDTPAVQRFHICGRGWFLYCPRAKELTKAEISQPWLISVFFQRIATKTDPHSTSSACSALALPAIPPRTQLVIL